MSDHSVAHATFVVEHAYSAQPAKVFAAFASREAKANWFGEAAGPEKSDLQLDFRVGGKETMGGGQAPGPIYKYEAIYQDIVTNRRIVYTYNMWMNDDLISVSVATADFAASGAGTKLTYTEQGAFLDGKDQPQFREHGTREMLVDRLTAYIEAK